MNTELQEIKTYDQMYRLSYQLQLKNKEIAAEQKNCDEHEYYLTLWTARLALEIADETNEDGKLRFTSEDKRRNELIVRSHDSDDILEFRERFIASKKRLRDLKAEAESLALNIKFVLRIQEVQ